MLHRIINFCDKGIDFLTKQKRKLLEFEHKYLLFCPHCGEILNLKGVVEHYIRRDDTICEYTFRCHYCGKKSTWEENMKTKEAVLKSKE